ncbi:hypothetical protein C4D60_Mb04t27090 [Musa balbisiana]|uniref:Uncharacterized protein n=1 Tax=Musa balbisiana TaxID=52838 RepID=A0A4S8KF01_MUSBA|nr:hypothetical protein C4D60_Mb04t27090 [Musa balbisiana]
MLPIHGGRSPTSPLLERSRIEMDDADDSQSGRGPEIPVSARTSLNMFIWPSQLGGLPKCNGGLKERSSSWRFRSRESSAGIGPQRRFRDRSNVCRLARLAKLEGILPVNRLLEKKMSVSVARRPMAAGS